MKRTGDRKPTQTEFEVKDSGKRQEYASGMRRDTQEGKPDYTLVNEAAFTRWAMHMTIASAKYGRGNYLLADSPEELDRFKASAYRHMVQWQRGDVDEDHMAAVMFNLAAAEMVKRKLLDKKPEPAPLFKTMSELATKMYEISQHPDVKRKLKELKSDTKNATKRRKGR